MDRRTDLLDGKCVFPPQLLGILGVENDVVKKSSIKDFWDNVWHNFLREKPVDSLIWYEAFGKDFFNSLLFHLSKSGWITSEISNNYAFLYLNESKLMKWIDKEDIRNIKYKYKMNKYRFGVTKSVYSDIVKVNNTRKKTGIVRLGFMKAGNHKFQYDTIMLRRYYKQIAENIKRGLKATNHDISYQEIIDDLIEFYSYDQGTYCVGNNISDSRGRSIFQCTKKLFNPVSHKDSRALLKIKPQELTNDGIKAVYAFIAELLGYRGKDYEDKVQYGESAYIMRTLPEVEEDYSNLYEYMWLKRIYAHMQDYAHTKQWSIPIEVDALASMIQLMGTLTNDHKYMDYTNLINPEEFKDIWTRPYCSRKHVKKALTPPLYGSSASPKQLWDKAKLPYTQIQINEITKDLHIGIYANAAKFKDFIINNVKPRKEMRIKIWNDTFNIECNRFKLEETTMKRYNIYTSAQGIVKPITKSVMQVPDVNQFKRYFVTLLLHNLDSRIADRICQQVPWVISNHDSWTVHPNDVQQVRDLYIQSIKEIYQNRKIILRKYFASIGILEDYPEKDSGEISEFSGYALK